MSRKQKQKELQLKRLPTKHQLAKWERQARWQRITTYASIGLIAAVLIFVGFGFYRDELGPRLRSAIRVDDRSYNLGYVTNALALYTPGMSPAQAGSMVGFVVEDIQKNELVKRGADTIGIGITEKDIKDKLDEIKLPDSQEIRDILKAQLLSQKLRSDYFGLQIPTSADQQNLEVMYLDSPKTVDDVKARIEKGESFTSLAKSLSGQTGTQANEGKTDWLPKVLMDEITGSDKVWEAASRLEKGVLSQPVPDTQKKPVGYWVIQVTRIADDGNRQVRAILVGNEDDANKVLTRLNTGEEFSKIASEVSQDQESKDKGGDLGIIPTRMSPQFRDAAEKLNVNQLGQPVRDETVLTDNGFWLIKVVDKEKGRKLDDSAREKLIDKAVESWLRELKKNAKLENLMTPEDIMWVTAHLPKPRTK
jgi:parvulin-like peptidyl-prolyl isomerase